MRFLALVTLGLSSLVSAAPAALRFREVSATQYEISILQTHFMGTNSGIGDGSWPPGSEFNSSIDLEIQYVPVADDTKTVSTACHASWPNGSQPLDWNACDDSGIGWKFVDFTTEALFTIEIGRSTDNTSADTGSVSIESNTPDLDDSWLTCLIGAPLAGITCNLNGTLSSQKGPIPVVVASGPAIGPFD